MGELMRRYWIPAAFSHQIAKPDWPADPRPAHGRESRSLPRHAGPRRPARRALSAPHRFAVLRPQRGERAALRLSRPQVRRRRQLRRPALRAADSRCCSTRASRLHEGEGLSLHRARRTWSGPIWARRSSSRNSPISNGRCVPASQRFATRHIQECNWLQGLEGGFDATHLTFLHGGDAEHEPAHRGDAATR